MRPVYQTLFKPPDGNCLQASLASVFGLDLEEVPNFVGEETWFYDLRSWLRNHCLDLLCFPWRSEWKGFSEDVYHLLDGPSPRGPYKHVVVGRGGEVAHDPFPGWTGPSFAGEPENIYIFTLTDPANFATSTRPGR